MYLCLAAFQPSTWMQFRVLNVCCRIITECAFNRIIPFRCTMAWRWFDTRCFMRHHTDRTPSGLSVWTCRRLPIKSHLNAFAHAMKCIEVCALQVHIHRWQSNRTHVACACYCRMMSDDICAWQRMQVHDRHAHLLMQIMHVWGITFT